MGCKFSTEDSKTRRANKARRNNRQGGGNNAGYGFGNQGHEPYGHSGGDGGNGGDCGGDGGGGGGGGGGQQAAMPAPTETMVANLNITGQNFDRRTVIGLVEQINELQEDGMRIRLNTV